MSRPVTVKEAAILAGRDPSRIYAWIRADRIASWETEDGTIVVNPHDVLELELIMRARRNNRSRRSTT